MTWIRSDGLRSIIGRLIRAAAAAVSRWVADAPFIGCRGWHAEGGTRQRGGHWPCHQRAAAQRNHSRGATIRRSSRGRRLRGLQANCKAMFWRRRYQMSARCNTEIWPSKSTFRYVLGLNERLINPTVHRVEYYLIFNWYTTSFACNCYFIVITSPVGAIAKYCEWVCLSVCLSVCPRGYIRNQTRDLYQFFVHARGSVLLWYVDDRPHRLSAWRWWQECKAQAKCNRRLSC